MPNIFKLDDNQLIEKFSQGSNQLLASDRMQLVVNGAVSQLMAKNGDPIAIMYLQSKPRTAIVKYSSPCWNPIDNSLQNQGFVLIGDASRPGFIEYKYYVAPAGYKAWYTDPSILWKKWWPTERFLNKQRFNMDILVSFKENWYPVQNISVHAGTFTIKTITGQLTLKRDDRVLWLAQITQEETPVAAPDIHQPEPAPSSESETLPSSGSHSQFQPKYSSTELAKKIQQKQSEINSEQAWTIIKELEQKLQSQIKLNAEIEERFNQSEHRAIIAEQRLKMVYNYLAKIGVSPEDIYG